MNKIYVSDNYIILDENGILKAFPVNHSEYQEHSDHFSLMKYPNKEPEIFSFTNIGQWFEEDGTTPYTIESLRTFLRKNTGFSSGVGGSTSTPEDISIPRIYKYTVDVHADLSLLEEVEEGDIARVYNSTGIWGVNRKNAGAYTYDGNNWVYGSRSLQDEILSNDAEIIQLQNDLAQEVLDRQNEISVLKLSDGWWNIQDTTFTQSNPQIIPSGIRTKLEINLDSVIDQYGSNSITASQIWDSVNNKITPISLGDSYIFRLSTTANPTLNNRNFTVDLDIGGTQGVIFERTTRLARGANFDTKVSMTNSIFALGTFISNGGEIYITCDGEVALYNISLFIQKITQND